MSVSINGALDALASSKIKERQEGIAALRRIFSNPHVLDSFGVGDNSSSKSNRWLGLFKKVFSCVETEKALYFKGTAAAEKRLMEAARLLRWLTEQSCHLINKKVVRDILLFVMKVMVNRRGLVTPIALDCIKTIRALVSYQAHLDHLAEDEWMELVQFGFNIILSDSPTKPLQHARPVEEEDVVMKDDSDDSATKEKVKGGKRKHQDTPPASPRKMARNSASSTSVSVEQVELNSILTILLCCPNSPILSSSFKHLPPTILFQLQRILVTFSPDSTLYTDFLKSLHGVLSTLTLNRKKDVVEFARGSWNRMVNLWGTKNKHLKEGLVAVLHILLPFVVASPDKPERVLSIAYDWSLGIEKLWTLLDGEAISKWGVDGLSLDAIRLDIHPDEISEAFVARTFRAGRNFDANQALAWAVLELQANCTEMLFRQSESHLAVASTSGRDLKRPRQDPVVALLYLIGQGSPSARVYRLQILLFFIDRYWSILHGELQQKVLDTLLQYISQEDNLIQSWTFLCIAAIAHADGLTLLTTSSPPSSISDGSRLPETAPSLRDSEIWDPIWTHAIRRANVPVVCRAACHAARVLLLSFSTHKINSRPLVSARRVLTEIESFAKDIDVQGPTALSDSVCMFISLCLQIASQDVRLFRMQLEDKALAWLIDTWRLSSTAGSDPVHLSKDIAQVVETICGFRKHSDLLCRIILPDCLITRTLIEEAQTHIIKEFSLHARLPPVQSKEISGPTRRQNDKHEVRENTAPVDASPRERKISSFFLRRLEAQLSELSTISPSAFTFRVEKGREFIETALLALTFETSLTQNGVVCNEHNIQAAHKVLSLCTPVLREAWWTLAEKGRVLLILEPLVSYARLPSSSEPWIGMIRPDDGTGIQQHVLKRLSTSQDGDQDQGIDVRRQFLRVIWQRPSAAEVLGDLLGTMRALCRALLSDSTSSHAAGMDDGDGFGAVNTHRRHNASSTREIRLVAEICIEYLAMGPILQSLVNEPTRDKELLESVLEVADENTDTFILVTSVLLQQVRQNTLDISPTLLDQFLDAIGYHLKTYPFSKNASMICFLATFLDATLHLWGHESKATEEVRSKIHILFDWFHKALQGGKIGSWEARDRWVSLLLRYVTEDPEESLYKKSKVFQRELLPSLGLDEDMRVRFRASVIVARLFAVGRKTGSPPMPLYSIIIDHLTKHVNDYELMLTRILTLGNIIISSSAIRRGPYWHIIEIPLFPGGMEFSPHIQTVLELAASSMGLASLSLLFEVYASQIAYSIRQGQYDFFRIPPHLLGYETHLQCAIASFRPFTPSNLIAPDKPGEINTGLKMFESHCNVIRVPLDQGLRDCFGDVVAILALEFLSHELESESDLYETIKEKLLAFCPSFPFNDVFQHNPDSIAAAMLQMLSDLDVAHDGVLVGALNQVDPAASSTFQALTIFRGEDHYISHQPNLPAFPAFTVIRGLQWLVPTPSDQIDGISYHVMHRIFAELQKTPLVNEQMRLLNALSLWISLHYSDFIDPSLIHTLGHSACLLLAQFDLARSAQSLLSWTFARYRFNKSPDPRFPDILVRACSLAYNYSREPMALSLGEALLEWVDAEAVAISRVPELRDQLLDCLPAWPHRLSQELDIAFQDVTSARLSKVLGSERITAHKFRIVRRLCDSEVYHGLSFPNRDFWHMKECIPSVEQLDSDDIQSFAQLLVLNKGLVSSYGEDQLLSPKNAYGRKVVDKRQQPEVTIILRLLSILESFDSPNIFLAYMTLRSVMGDPRNQHHKWQEYQSQVRYLEMYPCLPSPVHPREISELRTSECYLEYCHDFPRWVGSVSVLLADILSASNSFYSQLRDILHSDSSFASALLPILVRCVLREERAAHQSLAHSNTISDYFTAVLCNPGSCVPCLQSIVDVFLHLRHFQDEGEPDALRYNKWLGVDLTLLARTALTCGSYTTALLFAELAADPELGGAAENSATEIMYEIYGNIDEPDGFYGIKDQDHRHFLIRQFHHEKQWDKAFQFHGAALEAGARDMSESEGLLKSFHSFGFNHLASRTFESSASHTSSMAYHLGWRTETWDLPECQDDRIPGNALYLALRAEHRDRDPRTIVDTINDALSREIEHLRGLGSENIAQIRDVVQSLMCLSQLARWRSPGVQDTLSSKSTDLGQWSDFINMDDGFEFSDSESIMATRVSLVRSARQKEERQQIGSMSSPFTRTLLQVEQQSLLQISKTAREAQRNQIALNSVVRAERLQDKPSLVVSQEFAHVLWNHGEGRRAVQLLASLEVQAESDSMHSAMIKANLGTWTAEACLEKAGDILEKYFKPARRLARETKNESSPDDRALIYRQFAIFADREYHAIARSPDVMRWKVYLDRKNEEIKSLQARRTQLMNGNHAAEVNEVDDLIRKSRKVKDEDEKTYGEYANKKDELLVLAIEMYSRCLEQSDVYDKDSSIRLCSLWLANFDEVNLHSTFPSVLQQALARVPSRKFIFLAHQLAARLAQMTHLTVNQENLQALILRMCREHPFHSLYQVFCLKPATQHTRQSDRFSLGTQSARGMAASDIFDRLRSDDRLSRRVRDIERLSQVCLNWANYPMKKNKQFHCKRRHPVPKNAEILAVKNMDLPVMTYHLPLDPTTKYENFVSIVRFSSDFDTVGGKSVPKVSACIGSDSESYMQLFKGEETDDLRQDAVMVQVFEVVNHVLHQDRETRRRNLNIRDYKVIPLASQAGLLEFVGHTSTLKGWLDPAHPRYHPSDKSVAQMNKIFSDAKHNTLEQRAALYKRSHTVLFRPVMRHFFTERHKTPVSWFAMRLNYIRSVATTSIVGHVLGLGDRHTSNILIDQRTGEIVHIDLGIAFDQGKLLPIPELVPFRMTGDMIDGMGVSGTDGVFQRCAEETLRVLREESEVIMTILEVFRHDPLHTWTASEVKIKRAQPDTYAATTNDTVAYPGMGLNITMASGTAEEAADRALSGVSRKLSKELSVTSTVSGLIADATDPKNLGSIYCGWAPYM